jgi:hypothetical protein
MSSFEEMGKGMLLAQEGQRQIADALFALLVARTRRLSRRMRLMFAALPSFGRSGS